MKNPRASGFSMLLSLILFLAPSLSAFGASCELRSEAEKSGWIRTGRYDETERLVRCFERSFPGRVRAEKFGTTPEGRAMWALVVSDPLPHKGSRKPVVYFQGGIHAGEIDGKDAGFWLLRDILEGRALPGALKRLTLVFVPVLNVDGHERFGKNNRPNQIGPEEMGWRVTSQNLNLNRDYLKLDSPELRAATAYMVKRDPILAIDLHVTDGADFQNEVSVIVEPSLKGPAKLQQAAAAMSDSVQAKLKAMGRSALPFYPSFETEDDPASGVTLGMSTPRFFHGYWQLRNRIAVLVETHSWKNYATRVSSTRDTLVALIEQAQAKAASEWIPASRAADEEARALSKSSGKIALGWNADQSVAPQTFEFPGYAYSKVDSPVSGAKETVYDPSKKEIWKIPLWTALKPRIEVTPPKSAYVILPGAAAELLPRLKVHGIRHEVLKSARPAPEGLEVFRADEAEVQAKTSEGRSQAKLKGEWKKEAHPLPAGSVLVPVDQELGRLVLHALEPLCSDSFAAWGFFNAYLEQKEYLEPYVAHQAGLEMLEKDPALKAEFERKLSEDKAFRESPDKRREFFYRKHPSFDARHRLLPVYRY